MNRSLAALLLMLLVFAVDARIPRGFATGAGSTPTGTWVNVTPAGVNLTSTLDCGNFGTTNTGADSANPGTLYTEFNCQGIWKSTDYGATWAGPINTGTNGAVVGDCAGGITVSPQTPGTPATIYESCIRGGSITCTGCVSGTAIGLWISTDGGVNWTNANVAPLSSSRQDVYTPTIDPYDANHLLMAPHEPTTAPWLVESADGGHTWTSVSTVSGMQENGGTPAPFFINTGVPSTTRTTFLYISQDTPYGTWRTTNDGSSWTEVDTATHPHGIAQPYQVPDTGTIYLPELYGTEGSGVLLSTDYGVTWSQTLNSADSVVFGTPQNVYAMYGWACQVGPGCGVNPNFSVAPFPAGTSWSSPGTPSGMNNGNGAAQVAVANNGINSVAVASMWGLGVWRYVEPSPTVGTWINVTPPTIDLVDNLSCSNFGTKSVEADPLHPGYVYTTFMCQGVWVSHDYGQSWVGPVNTGSNAALVQDCAGTIAVAPTSSTTQPVLYLSCIRGTGLGFWKSTNGGVDWTLENVSPAPGGTGQQFYAPLIDPYDSTHLIMAGHTTSTIYESFNSGVTWVSVNVAGGMVVSGGTFGLEFVNTGSSATTKTTFLAAAPANGGVTGTWRTTNDGTSWTHVSDNEHITGEFQTYQPDTSGKIWMTGVYSSLGYGVFYSTDFGQTWVHQGLNQQEGIIVGTAKDLYAAYGFGGGPGVNEPPALETAVPPGTGSWSSPTTPGGMYQGPAQGAVENNGAKSIVLFANYNAGLWLYVEP